MIQADGKPALHLVEVQRLLAFLLGSASHLGARKRWYEDLWFDTRREYLGDFAGLGGQYTVLHEEHIGVEPCNH